MILKRKNLCLSILFLVFLCSGCKEFIEPSIDDKKVVLLAPSDGIETNDYTQIFWWEEVEDALSYRLQVVTPDFNHVRKLVLDTLVKKNTKFKSTLDPGKYEWRVKAQNGSSSTIYTTAAFNIYATSISEQQVQLDVPINHTITNQASVSFKWLRLFGAEKYRIQIDDSGNSFQDGATLFLDKTTSNLEYAVTFDKDKTYQWRVRAIAGVGATPGLALASAGTTIKVIGDGIEILTNFGSGDTQKGAEGMAKQVVDKLIDKAVDVLLPGPTPNMSASFSEAIKNAKDISKNATGVGKTVVEKVEEKQKEKTLIF